MTDRQLKSAAFVVIVVLLAVVIVAAAVTRDANVIGSLAAWVGATGTVGAFSIVTWTYTRERREKRAEQAEQVAIWVEHRSEGYDGWDVVVTNNSNLPIYSVVAWIQTSPHGWTGKKVRSPLPPRTERDVNRDTSVLLGQLMEHDLLAWATGTGEDGPDTSILELRFLDAAQRGWVRKANGELREMTTEQRAKHHAMRDTLT